ncbi:unnamed protein product [Urochloa humidicola]
MGALYDRAHTKDPTWHFGSFIIDDPLADIHTIRQAFQCPVLISLWRLQHARHKNLVSKCSDIEKRSAMAKFLGDAISNICRGSVLSSSKHIQISMIYLSGRLVFTSIRTYLVPC